MKCPHCNNEINKKINIQRHLERCVLNPKVEQKTKRLLIKLSTNGKIPKQKEYIAATRGTDYPSIRMLKEQIGNWAMIAEWAGLRGGGRPKRNPDEIKEKHTDDYLPPELAELKPTGIVGVEALNSHTCQTGINRGVKRIYHPQRYSWVTVEVIELR